MLIVRDSSAQVGARDRASVVNMVNAIALKDGRAMSALNASVQASPLAAELVLV